VSRFNDEILLGETFFYKARRDIWWTIKIFFKDSALSRKSLDLMEEDILRMKQAFEGAVYEARKIKSAPQFTYCHFLNAHGPWYFDSSGKRLDPMRTSLAGANRDDYINNIIYANKSFIIPVVDSIKKNAKRPYVIILQGDHGYTEYPKHKKNLVFRNLNAWYFSDRDYSGLYESLSSVNTFRVILNKYFGANIPLLKDSSIYLDKLTTGK
jgi:phosphoglycerol transferase MdoB-like AlkP superfamily enzyme